MESFISHAQERRQMTAHKTGAAAGGAQIAEPYMVFLVEDDQDDRALMTKTLRQSPHIHEIRPYDSGDTLLFDLGREMYYSNSVIHTLPTVILLDMHMPGAGGMAALRQLKSHTLTANVPVIVSTNDSSPETMREAKRLNANAYLIKPLNLEELHQALAGAWLWPDSVAG
jgi:CheY-like chemotaxis protein